MFYATADIDECNGTLTNMCDIDAACVNENGGFKCKCNAGFVGDGITCNDPKNKAIMKVGHSLTPSGEVWHYNNGRFP